MESSIAAIVAHNVVSPLGLTSADNYEAVKDGRTAVRVHSSFGALQGPLPLAVVDGNMLDDACAFIGLSRNDYTRFEKMLILSISQAVADSEIDLSSPRVIFIISTTKGNVELLDRNASPSIPRERVFLATAAKQVARYFNNPNNPLVVSNACTSGLCAQIAAMRCLQCGDYDYAVVAGCDVLSPFIISGFQSFKAVSSQLCRPFDMSRDGLNLGEAAATVVYSRHRSSIGGWVACRGAIRNDANHISGPSRTGEGCYRALSAVVDGVGSSELAFVNVHGTATVYNDEMESIALQRAGLLQVPVTGLKGYFGHTLGAAGVLETIMSMLAVDDHIVPGTLGFASLGVSAYVQVSCENRITDKQAFVKMLSGFGGCNAAMLFKKGGDVA